MSQPNKIITPTTAIKQPDEAGPMSPKSMPTDWGSVAEWYDQLVGEGGSDFHRNVVLPGLLRMLPLKPGDQFLDVACGQGVVCRLLALRGIHCTGIDASLDLIRIARQRGTELKPAEREPLGTQLYQVGDARELLSVPADRFDAAACVLAIQNMHPIGAVFQGIRRCLKVGGKVVVVMMHPAFRSPKETAWGWDETEGVQYRRVNQYLLPRKHPIVTHPGKKTGEYTWSFHRPISEYIQAMTKAGLLIDGMEEWPSHKNSDSGPRARAENIARKEIPMFLAIRGIRTA